MHNPIIVEQLKKMCDLGDEINTKILSLHQIGNSLEGLYKNFSKFLESTNEYNKIYKIEPSFFG